MKKRKLQKFILASSAAILLFKTDVSAATCVVHTVVSGDNLWQLSENYQVSFTKVLEYNTHFNDPDLIYPGDTVYIPINVIDYEPLTKEHNYVPKETQPSQEQPSTNEETKNNEDSNTNDSNSNGNNTNSNDNNTNDDNMKDNNTNDTNNNNSSSTDSEFSDLEQAVLALVNEERAKEGLSPLKFNESAASVTRIKSQDMIDKGYFDHTSPTYGDPGQMLKTFGVSYRSYGENIAYGQTTAQQVMNTWMNSSGHRANILNAGFTEIGIGCADTSNGTIYWTQIFLTP